MRFILMLQTPTPTVPREFDAGIVWRTLRNLGDSFLAQLPYIIIGIIVFVAFLIVARIVRRVIYAAGKCTRLDHSPIFSDGSPRF